MNGDNTRKYKESEIRTIWQGKKLPKIEAEGTWENKKKAINNAKNNLLKKISNTLQNNNYLPENVSLLLTKYIPLIAEKEDYSLLEKDIFHKEEFFSLIKKTSVHCNKNKIELEGFVTLIDTIFKTSNRMVCGLGASSVLETSITLHHIWGVPYIPGSSFKGVCREVAFWELVHKKQLLHNTVDTNENDNDIEKLNEFQKKFYGQLCIDDPRILAYQLLFGAQDFKGLFLFLDAYPDESNNIFELDIMNPHYGSFYSDKECKTPPGDWENPVPVFFLTVKAGVKFRFSVLFDKWRWENLKSEGFVIERNKNKYIIHFESKSDNKENKKITINKEEIEHYINDKNFLINIIQLALCNYGIGSKRNVAYGNFTLQDINK